MLCEFRVKGFKNFAEEIRFDLTNVKNYEFNTDAIRNNIVNTCLIYGENGSGKTNLTYAIFDIIINLTDKERNLSNYRNYLNLDKAKLSSAVFYYKFIFDDIYLEYSYTKSASQAILDEKLQIDGNLVADYNHLDGNGKVTLEGTETLNIDLNEKSISFIKYIHNNAVLVDNKVNNVFKSWMDFVDNMLLFSSLEKNLYQGFQIGNGSIAEGIIELNKVKEFENFLRKVGIDYKLVVKDNEDGRIICVDFNGRFVNLFSIASRGTSSYALFFYWLQYLDKVSLVCIDEFDAFYHNDLAKTVVQELVKIKCQAILTTHNTSIMNNDLLRPDCFFKVENNKITAFADKTDKVLRKAHNIEKMYRAGAFDEENHYDEE